MTEIMHAYDLIARRKQKSQQDASVEVPEIIDPPVENQPQP